MRIRQIKPAFWSDGRIAELPEGTRLFYVGLWMIADDAGWFRWDPVEVARDLYGYEGRARRERRTAAMFDQLTAIGRIVLHECGHAEVPKLGDHQHLAGSTKQVRSSFNEHLRGCVSPTPAHPREDPRTPADPRESPPRLGKERVRSGDGTEKERKGKVNARSLAPEGATALTDEEDLPTYLRVVTQS